MQEFKFLRTRDMRDVGKLAALFLPIAVLLSVFVGPHLNVDGQVVASMGMGDFVVPHFAFGYPLLTRGVNFLVEIAGFPFTWEFPSGIRNPQYSKLSIQVLMLFQHFVVILAAIYFAISVALTFWVRALVVVLIYFFPPMFVYTHSVLTESISFALFIFAAAEMGRIARSSDGQRSALIRFFIFIGLSVLFKHVFVIFAGMPIGWLLIMSLTKENRAQLAQRFGLAEAKILIGGLVAVLFVPLWMNNMFMKYYDIEPRSILGRAFVYRLSDGMQFNNPQHERHKRAQFYENSAARKAIIDDLIVKTSDETQKKALRVLAEAKGPWVDPWNGVYRLVQLECQKRPCNRSLYAQTDIVLNQIARDAIFTTDPRLWRDSLMRTAAYLLPASVTPLRSIEVLKLLKNPFSFSRVKINNLSSKIYPGLNFDTLSGYYMYISGADNFFTIIKLAMYEIFFVIILFSIFISSLVFRRVFPLPIAFVGGACLYAICVSTVTTFIERYVDVLMILYLLALIALISEISQIRAKRREELASTQISRL